MASGTPFYLILSFVNPGQSVSVIIGASPGAATGQFHVSAQATNGSLSQSASLSLTIQSGVLTTSDVTVF